MNASSRRIYLYWVLLLLPTLGVGLGAMYLLNREEGRLLARAGQLEEARRSALRVRAQLAAENAEFIISDLQSALLDTLASAPAADADVFLLSLERVNPLVHSTFRCDSSGLLLRPLASDEEERARGFYRRFSGVLRTAPFVAGERLRERQAQLVPFSTESRQEKDVVATPLQQAPSSNYAQNVQNARRDVQSLAKLSKEQSAVSKGTGAQAPSNTYSRRSKSSYSASDSATVRPSVSSAKSASSTGAPVTFDAPQSEDSKALRADGLLEQAIRDAALNKLETAPATPVLPQEAPRAPAPTAERRGWLPVTLDHRLFMLGYVQPGALSEVRGIELDMTALVSRLGAALPPELAVGEGLCLRNERGRIFHQVGLIPAAAEAGSVSAEPTRESSFVVRVPLSGELLPGWFIDAYLRPSADLSSGGASSFLLTGSLLAAILVIALLSGGFLLLQQARESAREALMKTSFVANVSHELKTPLTTIRLYADLLEQGRVPSEERRAEYLRTIGRESERLSRLVNNVLDFSRLERGLRAFELAPLDPAAELRRICDVNTPRLADAGLRLSLVLPDEPLRVAADRDALGQILLNLLDNAVKYAASGGELRISLSRGEAGRVLLRVADRGPGVPSSERERIFLKFHRVDQSLTAEKGGAGLGLSIARQLARAMQGELSCLPREGGGAVFELSLPALSAEALV